MMRISILILNQIVMGIVKV